MRSSGVSLSQWRGFLLMFRVSLNPEAWRDTLVQFNSNLAVTSFSRPLWHPFFVSCLKDSLSSVWSTWRNMITGSRTSNLHLDCVASVLSDIRYCFGESERTLTLALDIKGAIDSVLSEKLIKMRHLGILAIFLNFVSFLISRRNLCSDVYRWCPTLHDKNLYLRHHQICSAVVDEKKSVISTDLLFLYVNTTELSLWELQIIQKDFLNGTIFLRESLKISGI